MKLCIPGLGEALILKSEWQFTLLRESRNTKFAETFRVNWKHDGSSLVTLLKGTALKVDRVYIRQGAGEYDSVTFRIVGQKNSRFWVRRSDANKIEFEEPPEPQTYRIQHRYQDSGWMDLEDGWHSWEAAIKKAAELCKDAIAVGMTRVMDCKSGRILVEFPAGGY